MRQLQRVCKGEGPFRTLTRSPYRNHNRELNDVAAGSEAAREYTGVTDVLTSLAATDGPFAVWDGLGAQVTNAVLKEAILNTIRQHILSV